MGSEQHYSLRWNDYTVKIVTAFQSLRDEEDFVDVTVACDGHSYSAHKMVLSACSPYFRALLRANPCQHPIVILKDVGHVELERLLEFMYNGEVSIAQDQLAAFLRTAENLKIRGLAGSSDDMDQLGLQRPDVSYSYSSCSIGGAGGTSGRSSPSAGYAPSQGSKDEEVGGDGSGGYHARAESPPSKRRKRLSAPAAGHADLNTETHSSDNSEMSGRYRCQHILTSDLYYEGRVMVLGRAPLDPIKVSADTGPAKRTYGETSLDDECVVEATVEIESGGSLSGTLPGEDDVRQDRRELKSEPGDVMAEVYSETSELTDPTSHSGEGLDPRQSVLYPLALPGPSGAAGNQDSVGPHESGDVSALMAIANAAQVTAPSDRPMKCPLCMSIIKQARNLRRHVLKRHLPAAKRGEITEADVKIVLEKNLKAITVTPLTEEELQQLQSRVRKKGKGRRKKGVASLPAGVNGSNINESEVTIRKLPHKKLKKDKAGNQNTANANNAGMTGDGGNREDILQEALAARDKDMTGQGVMDLATGQQQLPPISVVVSHTSHSGGQMTSQPMSLTVTQTASGVHARIPAEAALGAGVRLQADSPLPLHRDLPVMTPMAFEPQVTISEGMITYHTTSPSQVPTQTTAATPACYTPTSYWTPTGMPGLSPGTFQAHQSVFAPTHTDYFAAGMHMTRPSALERMQQHRRKPYQ
ncbi:transcription activator GAGA-like isoform X2 [Macrobrachium rosenbergii]|uniref:transcription activator GAGA-like isoform X2 n=1 Tax=Macrobrachium rosenbergii TaxID=79674 RepID=UPI0034D6C901